VVETPHRFDDPKQNVLIETQNKTLKSICNANSWCFLSISSILDRSCFTRHGLHLNPTGKDILSSLIANLLVNVSRPLVVDGAPDSGNLKGRSQSKNENVDLRLDKT